MADEPPVHIDPAEAAALTDPGDRLVLAAVTESAVGPNRTARVRLGTRRIPARLVIAEAAWVEFDEGGGVIGVRVHWVEGG